MERYKPPNEDDIRQIGMFRNVPHERGDQCHPISPGGALGTKEKVTEKGPYDVDTLGEGEPSKDDPGGDRP
jgi:hypothetical protein